jgi:hypothetical protein
MFDHLLPFPADRPGRTLGDGLCPKSHKDGTADYLPGKRLSGAIERDYNHAKFGGRRVRLYKIGELFFLEGSGFCRLDARQSRDENKVRIIVRFFASR